MMICVYVFVYICVCVCVSLSLFAEFHILNHLTDYHRLD